jgi:metal-responsive CopG/Arc/MetJ family transcriptional regulator
LVLTLSENQKLAVVKTSISEELRNSFKAACAKEGRNMSDVLSDFIEQYVTDRETELPSSRKKGKGDQ